MAAHDDMKKQTLGVTGTYSPPVPDGSVSEGDVEVGKQRDLQRALRPRHLQMIAIGGVIGSSQCTHAVDLSKAMLQELDFSLERRETSRMVGQLDCSSATASWHRCCTLSW